MEQLENKKELHRRGTKEEEGVKERDCERNKTEATLRSCVRELESALRDQTEYYEVRLQASEIRENTLRCVNVGKQKLLYEKERTVRELAASRTRSRHYSSQRREE